MSIQSEITRIAQNVSDSFDAVAAKGGTRPQAQNSSNLPDAILSIPAAGVQSFNGRTGDVEPQEGDYSAEMVGAQPTINVSGILKGNGSGGVSAAVAGTDFAPAGYGLGEIPPAAPTVDGITYNADGCTKNGWYRASQNTPKTGWWYIFVCAESENILTQFAFSIEGASGVKDGTIAKRYRSMTLGAWSAWEYINPPMEVGVEYRTTERYMRKPVYVKLVDCGYLPNATYKTVAYSDDTNCRSIWGCGHTGSSIFPSLNFGLQMATSLADAGNVSLWINNNNISIACGGNRSTIRAYVIVKYYKTTD